LASIIHRHNAIKLKPKVLKKIIRKKACIIFLNLISSALFFPKSLTALPRHQ
jgi:hypothetical protein